MLTEPCPECGVADALGRHAGDCPRAIEIGLPRLSEGEDPIEPSESLSDDFEELEAQPPVPLRPSPPAPRRRAESGSLWISYRNPHEVDEFDAVVFDSELEALRHAVNAGWQVVALELGRSLADQCRG